jgi:hypothetical protein
MKLKNALAGALFAGLLPGLVVGVTFGNAPRTGWRWQPQQCWIERIPGSGLGPQRVCR